MTVRMMERRDLPAVIRLWNASVEAGEVLYFPLSEAYFRAKFEQDPNYSPELSLVAEEKGEVIGFASGLAKKVFLDHETNENTPGFLTCVFVDKSHRRHKTGTALIHALADRFRVLGKTRMAVGNWNPLNLDWHIPGTAGHDHNNAPGVDTACAGYPFLQALGFREEDREIALYLDLRQYQPLEGLEQIRARLLSEGIATGRYDASLNYDYDRLCDRVHSEYWREVLRTELACWREGRPNTDPRFIPDGRIPAGPRPLLVATNEKHIVAFTGPVDLQASGRGWFCGICTDPEYEKRGIASVLFHLLMQEFRAEGAAFSTIFTGETNHAQRIYLRAGFRIVRTFALMGRAI